MKRRDAKILARRLCRKGYPAVPVWFNADRGWMVLHTGRGWVADFETGDPRRFVKAGKQWAAVMCESWPTPAPPPPRTWADLVKDLDHRHHYWVSASE